MAERKRVKLEERGGVLGKECTKCGIWKTLDNEFSKKKDGLGGKRSDCKVCEGIRKKQYTEKNKEVKKKYDQEYHQRPEVKRRKREYREENRDRVHEWQRKFYKRHKERILIKQKDFYRDNKEKIISRNKKYAKRNPDKRRDYQLSYKRNNREHIKSYMRKYYEINKEHLAELNLNWRKNNREKVKVYEQRRRARKRSLPDSWDHLQRKLMWEHFGNACALTREKDNISEEHALPLSVGHGGTILQNMYPLLDTLNFSKQDRNLFEWFESNRQRFELSQSKFDRLTEWLASANALTVEEYREFYDWCFANPRNINEIKADKRHSIEIWREAVGKQFPLPAYTETYRLNDSVESEAE